MKAKWPKEDMFGKALSLSLESKVEKAIAVFKQYEQLAFDYDPDGYYLCFSGGKDSVVLRDLAQRAGIKATINYNVTGIDPPELVRFIRKEHPDVKFHRSERPFFRTLVESKGVPTRKLRWCCNLYKERGGEGKVKVLGVRAAESPRRKQNWRILTPWKKGGVSGTEVESWCICPILYWTDEDIWDYIKQNNIPYCSLYDEGFKRLGCIGCPMVMKHREEQFRRWPKYERLWKKALKEYWERQMEKHQGTINSRTGRPYFACRFDSPEHLWKWWMTNEKSPDGCTMGMF